MVSEIVTIFEEAKLPLHWFSCTYLEALTPLADRQQCPLVPLVQRRVTTSEASSSHEPALQ